ncbi:MAG TPA: AAA family ATPase [Acidimicrobiia bacterium]|nr:AAA family ATPase [Acidimicrobiia bacterium]
MARTLFGREDEGNILEEAVAGLSVGMCGTYLVAGDAGVGKTTLVESVLSRADIQVLRGGAHGGGAEPYGPLRTALRGYLRSSADGADQVEMPPMALSLLMPTLGGVPPETKPEEVRRAMREAFERVAEHHPTAVFVDDLQWADAATLTLLADWMEPPTGLPLLLIGAYRSDELPRQHLLRTLRARLRRAAGPQAHIHLGPLALEDSAQLVRGVLGDRATPEVIDTVHRRARGLPFYIQELASAVAQAGEEARAIAASEVVPESVRDAILLRIAGLSDQARMLAEIAAAAGSPVGVDVLVELADDGPALEEMFESGLLVEQPSGKEWRTKAAFHHDLVGEALYRTTPWARRRHHHAALASALEARGESPSIVAAHWTAAHKPARARPLLVSAAEAAWEVHAYRDAKNAIEAALGSWPAGEDEGARLSALDRLGDCAERCGEIEEACRAWEEAAAAYRSAGDHEALALTKRRLAGVHELAGDWPHAMAARRTAAEEFIAAGRPLDAAGERMAAAHHLIDDAHPLDALRLVQAAQADIEVAKEEARDASPVVEATWLQARALALEGLIRAELGERATGVEMSRAALDLVLDAGPDAIAAEVYALHAFTLERAADHAAGLDVLTDAVTFCRSRGLDAEAHVCMACLAPALRHTGEWDRALDVGREVLADGEAPEVARMVASAVSGLIMANRGKVSHARRLLTPAVSFAQAHELFSLEIEATWGLARLDELAGDHDIAATRLRELIYRCLARDERHYSVPALRWASTFFGRNRHASDLGACTDLLARISAATGTAEATGALAHALGESALLEGDARRAADQFERTLELLSVAGTPAEVAETQVRAGAALGTAGDRDKAVERLVSAYNTARALGARPLAAAALAELEALGEDLESRFGPRAARYRDPTSLTPREHDVLELIAAGLTNRGIAEELFVSTRTVDMHVRNLLAKLSCRTRTEAVRRAGELELLAST